jgi:hypothetical protein
MRKKKDIAFVNFETVCELARELPAQRNPPLTARRLSRSKANSLRAFIRTANRWSSALTSMSVKR